eukprot:909149-Prymnesium_polylepis.1
MAAESHHDGGRTATWLRVAWDTRAVHTARSRRIATTPERRGGAADGDKEGIQEGFDGAATAVAAAILSERAAQASARKACTRRARAACAMRARARCSAWRILRWAAISAPDVVWLCLLGPPAAQLPVELLRCAVRTLPVVKRRTRHGSRWRGTRAAAARAAAAPARVAALAQRVARRIERAVASLHGRAHRRRMGGWRLVQSGRPWCHARHAGGTGRRCVSACSFRSAAAIARHAWLGWTLGGAPRPRSHRAPRGVPRRAPRGAAARRGGRLARRRRVARPGLGGA